MSAHSHDFTGLWSNFGPRGPQDVHYHVCHGMRCTIMLIGEGHNCDGKPESHREGRLGDLLADAAPGEPLTREPAGGLVALPWRLGPLTDDERIANLAKARRMTGQYTDPNIPTADRPNRDAMVWCAVCMEYEDLLARLGHGLEDAEVDAFSRSVP